MMEDDTTNPMSSLTAHDFNPTQTKIKPHVGEENHYLRQGADNTKNAPNSPHDVYSSDRLSLNNSGVNSYGLQTDSWHDDDLSSGGSSDEDLDPDSQEMSLAGILYSASSYHAIVVPVTITMTLAALAAVFVNNDQTIAEGAEQFASAYTVWKLDDSNGSNNAGKNLALSIANTFVIVCVIAAITFGIVLLYRFRCMKCLISYMIFSSAMLLGLMGDLLSSVAIEIYRIPIDVFTYYLSLYNFAFVGIVAIFYQNGIPTYLTQMYLIATSVILAWNFSHFDDWTAWTLLVMLALYDLCAVLTPCGPLKALVNLMQEDDAPDMPGLLYEAKLPAGAKKPGETAKNPKQKNENANSGPSEEDKEEQHKHHNTRSINNEKSITQSDSNLELLSNQRLNENTRIQPKTIKVPLAIAKVYQLPIVSMDNDSTISMPKNTNKVKRRSRRNENTNINEEPFLEESFTFHKSFYQQEFSPKDLHSEVEVELPQRGGKIVSLENDNKYAVISSSGELKRILTIDKSGKVFEVLDDDDESSSSGESSQASIRLGLGDFIFYSVLVSKAAMYSFTTFASCMLVILAGLGGTLVLLSVYQSALPALPISIFLGVTFYLLTRLFIEPFIEAVMTAPLYI